MPGPIHPDAPNGPLAEALEAALGTGLVGLYAYGSAVSGGFDPGVSDLDTVAVTERDAVDLDLRALDRAHRAVIARRPDWRDRLEVVYIGANTLRAFRTSGADLAVVSPGEPLHLSGPVRDWLQNWYLVRETGITLSGRDAAQLVPQISLEEFLAAVASYAAWLASRDLEGLAPGALAYAVLSECRALCTVRTGRQCSKQEGALWVASREPRWAALIDAALACRLSGGAIGVADPETRAAAVEFVRLAAAWTAG
jgi:hypothetical protein